MIPVPRLGGRLGLALGSILLISMVPSAAVQKVPITFTSYHGYTGTLDYLKKVAAAYPAITELIEIGKSMKGRSIYVLVVSNLKTGTPIDTLVSLRNQRSENVKNVPPMRPYHAKPALWIDGGMRGDEFTGTEVCLYIIDKLVGGYGADPALTKLIDESAFYICPIVNPDGVFSSVDTGIAQRGNSMMEDDDHDGKVNEDGPDDLDRDGLIAQFRYRDPKGSYIVSDVDPRVMLRVAAGEAPGKDRYSVVVEDRDNDGDGKRGEDSEEGIDVSLNFPEGWWRDDQTPGGNGFYPSSSPEAHAVLEFFTNHTNILLVQSYRSSGGFTVRPFARWPDSRHDARDLAVYDRVLGRKYLELIGETVPASWLEQPAAGPSAAGASIGPAGRGRSAGASAAPSGQLRGWQHEFNEVQKTPGAHGAFLDWAHAQFGAYAVSTALWNWQRDSKGLPGYRGEDDRARWEAAFLAYQEKALGGRAFVPWKRFTHPDLGDGEIGGWVSTYAGANAIPGESLAGVCETQWQFELFKAGLLPRLEITEVKGTVLYAGSGTGAALVSPQGDVITVKPGTSGSRYRVIQVTATIANTGQLPTHTATGATLRGNREDVVWLLADRDKVTFLQGAAWQRLGTLAGVLALPGGPPAAAAGGGRGAGRGGAAGAQAMPGQLREQRPAVTAPSQTGNLRVVTWLVGVTGETSLKVAVTSQKGGTKVKDVVIN